MNEWKPMSIIPQNGQVLIGVWEGEWREPRREFRIYEATCFQKSQAWNRQYRTAEGEAYEVVAWMEKPSPPK